MEKWFCHLRKRIALTRPNRRTTGFFCCAQRRNGHGKQLEKKAFSLSRPVKALVGAPSADLMRNLFCRGFFLLVRQSARAAHRLERAW